MKREAAHDTGSAWYGHRTYLPVSDMPHLYCSPRTPMPIYSRHKLCSIWQESQRIVRVQHVFACIRHSSTRSVTTWPHSSLFISSKIHSCGYKLVRAVPPTDLNYKYNNEICATFGSMTDLTALTTVLDYQVWWANRRLTHEIGQQEGYDSQQ